MARELRVLEGQGHAGEGTLHNDRKTISCKLSPLGHPGSRLLNATPKPRNMKRKPANIQINEWLSKQQKGLAICQEPNQKKGRIMFINSEVTQYTGGPASRACILMSKQMSKYFIKVDQLCSNDQVVISTEHYDRR